MAKPAQGPYAPAKVLKRSPKKKATVQSKTLAKMKKRMGKNPFAK